MQINKINKWKSLETKEEVIDYLLKSYDVFSLLDNITQAMFAYLCQYEVQAQFALLHNRLI